MDQILCRHTITKAECCFPADVLPAWRAVGWLPVDEWPADPPPPPAVTGGTPADPESPAPESETVTAPRAGARTKE